MKFLAQMRNPYTEMLNRIDRRGSAFAWKIIASSPKIITQMLYPLYFAGKLSEQKGVMFQSPCGELIIKVNHYLGIFMDFQSLVSVPLRGIGYESFCPCGADYGGHRVSVPLRGIGYESLLTGQTATILS